MKLKQLVKVLPEFEPVRIMVFNKYAKSTVQALEYTEIYFKRKIPDDFLTKNVYQVIVDDFDSMLTVGIIK